MPKLSQILLYWMMLVSMSGNIDAATEPRFYRSARRQSRALLVLSLTIAMCTASGGVAMRKLQPADPADIF